VSTSGIAYVDTHCHLDHHDTLGVAEQVERARAAGVTTLVTVGTDLASSRAAVATARAFGGVHAAVGIHPNDADGATPDALAELAELALAPEVVAIGETGLDRHWDRTTPEVQEAAFRAQIELAKRTERALVVHCREAWEDCLAILEDAGAPERVVLHCYSGDPEVTLRCVAAGHLMSFAGNVTFANAHRLRESAALVPAELLLTETDAPFLTPHPHRGRPNDPSFLPITLRALAELRREDPDELARTVLANARRVFALPPEDAAVDVGRA
jgi:TatD DNase family protein